LVHVEHSELLGFILQLKNVGWKSNENFPVKFDVASNFVPFDKSATFWVLLDPPLSHDNVQIVSMYSKLNAKPMRDYCFETIYHRKNFDVDKK